MKHLVHWEHSNGFSLVWDRTWRFKCSSRAKDLPHVVQAYGRGLLVLSDGCTVAPFWEVAPLSLVEVVSGKEIRRTLAT